MTYAYYLSIYPFNLSTNAMLYSYSSGEGIITHVSRSKPRLWCSVDIMASLVSAWSPWACGNLTEHRVNKLLFAWMIVFLFSVSAGVGKWIYPDLFEGKRSHNAFGFRSVGNRVSRSMQKAARRFISCSRCQQLQMSMTISKPLSARINPFGSAADS